MTVRRFDSGELKKPTKLPNGWLRVDARISRTGVLEYQMADGSVKKELRLPEEVFHQDSLQTFALVPVTDGHPNVFLDATNTKEHAVGAVGDTVGPDGKFLKASMLITDAAVIRKLEKGEQQEVSIGYSCDLEETPGEFEGERYDCIQRNIRGNHVAIVARGRAGPEVRVRLDSSDAVMRTETTDEKSHSLGGNKVSKKIRIDGVEYEAPEQTAAVVERELQKRADTLTKTEEEWTKGMKEIEALKARLDSLTEELKKESQARKDAEDPKRLRELVNARVALETKAQGILGSEVKLDEMDERAIKVAVVTHLSPEFQTDGKSDEYISARFDLELEKAQSRNSGLENLRIVAGKGHADSAPADSKTAYQRMVKANAEAWKTPLSANKQGAA